MAVLWKWRTLALFASLLALVLCILVFFLVHVDQYINMSTAQADAQVVACQKAGGDWQAGFSSVYCNVSFSPPDTSWYITPISNPNYETWHIVQPLLIILACALSILVGRLLPVLFLSFRTGRNAASACLGR